jgi:hypothetical protein
MRNWLCGLPGWITCEQSAWWQKKMMNMLLTLLFTCLTSLVCPEPNMTSKHLCTTRAFFH